ncbi:MAG: hypothetical protein ACKV2V_26165 [Blastocatellia bacterium]
MQNGEEQNHTFPRHCSLDGFTELSSLVSGLDMNGLSMFDMIRARTLNSDYSIFLLDPQAGRALVQGGRFFAEPSEAVINGSTFGGCMLKTGWIGVGLRIEIFCKGQCIVTSPVQEISLIREA